MRTTATLSAAVLVALCGAAEILATPSYYQLLRKMEKPPAKSPLDRARCRTCHLKSGGGRGLNPFGLDFKEAGADERALRTIEPKDSDGDGFSNLDEIDRGTLPGEKNSHPD